MNETKDILNMLFEDQDLAESTRISYRRSVRYFEAHVGMDLSNFFKVVEKEEDDGVKWRDRRLKKELISFRKCLIKKYKISTALTYYSKIIALLNYYEFEIGKIKHP